MKKSVLVMLTMAFALNLLAQRSGPAGNDRQIERMRSELSLSEEQYSRLKKAHEASEHDQAKVRADTALTQEKMIAERRVMMEKRSAAIKEILTKEQYEKWMAMKPGDGRRGRPDGKKADTMEEMKKELTLSDEQVKKIKELNAEMTARFQKVRTDTAMTRAERPKAVREVVTERNEKIKKILTQEQYEKFLAYEKAKAQMRRRGPKASPRR